jgi:hypothetical protein
MGGPNRTQYCWINFSNADGSCFFSTACTYFIVQPPIIASPQRSGRKWFCFVAVTSIKLNKRIFVVQRILLSGVSTIFSQIDKTYIFYISLWSSLESDGYNKILHHRTETYPIIALLFWDSSWILSFFEIRNTISLVSEWHTAFTKLKTDIALKYKRDWENRLTQPFTNRSDHHWNH